MSANDYDEVIAAFIRAKGVTRCPTACAAATQAVVTAADRSVLRQHAELRECSQPISSGGLYGAVQTLD